MPDERDSRIIEELRTEPTDEQIRLAADLLQVHSYRMVATNLATVFAKREAAKYLAGIGWTIAQIDAMDTPPEERQVYRNCLLMRLVAHYEAMAEKGQGDG